MLGIGGRMNRAQFLLAQVGRPARRKQSLSVLLTHADLAGDEWRTLGQVAWRMGTQKRLGEISRRSRKSGEFTALRRFRQEDPPRGLFVQVAPFASEEDAAVAAAIEPPSDQWNRWPGVTRLAKRTEAGLEVPSVADVHAWEYQTQRGEYRGYQRIIQGRVDSVLLGISGTAREPGWAWEDLAAVASAQAEKVRAITHAGVATPKRPKT